MTYHLLYISMALTYVRGKSATPVLFTASLKLIPYELPYVKFGIYKKLSCRREAARTTCR